LWLFKDANCDLKNKSPFYECISRTGKSGFFLCVINEWYLLFVLIQKVTKKSRQTQRSAALPGQRPLFRRSILFLFSIHYKWRLIRRPCCMFCGDHESAVFRLKVATEIIFLKQGGTRRMNFSYPAGIAATPLITTRHFIIEVLLRYTLIHISMIGL